MKRLIPFLAPGIAAIPLILNLYAAWWALQYRVPPGSANQIVDMRQSQSETPHYVTFCASLANNPHGFPGHAVVVWSKTKDWNRPDSETSGFVPGRSMDQFASLFTYVPGQLVNGRPTNMINPDAITAIVNEEEFEKTRRLRDDWNPSRFKTGVRDCVAFVDFIAEDVGLVPPVRRFDFPQDHIKQLKILNTKSLTRIARSSAPQCNLPSNCSSDFDHTDENKNDAAD